MAKSKLDALLEAIGSGGTAGFADEIDGAIGGAQEAMQDGSGVDGFWKSYEKSRDASRRSRQESEDLHPIITGAGEAVGTGLGSAATLGLAGPAMAGRAGLAFGGALEGIGRSGNNGVLNSGIDAATGAGKALLAGEALKGVWKAGGKLKDLAERLRGPKFADAELIEPELSGEVSFDFLKPRQPVLAPLPKLKGGAANATGEDVVRKAEASSKLKQLLKDIGPIRPEIRVNDPEMTMAGSRFAGPVLEPRPKIRDLNKLVPGQTYGGSPNPELLGTELYSPEIMKQHQAIHDRAYRMDLEPPEPAFGMGLPENADDLIIKASPTSELGTGAASPKALRTRK